MKKLSYLLSLLILLFFFFLIACESKQTKEENSLATPENIHTLIFIDKTASVDVSKPFVAEKFKSSLKKAVQENINEKGDKLDIYYIHENTSKGKVYGYACTIKRPEIEEASPTDREAAMLTYKSKVQKEHSKVLRNSLDVLVKKNESSSNLETNILASISVINAAKGSEAKKIRVYYLSDMIESVKNGRDFQKKAPKDEQEAKSWAALDAEKINAGTIHLDNVSVTIILPFDATASSKINNPMVSIYWKTLFEALGVSSITEE